jgi:hypothetical protein
MKSRMSRAALSEMGSTWPIGTMSTLQWERCLPSTRTRMAVYCCSMPAVFCSVGDPDPTARHAARARRYSPWPRDTRRRPSPGGQRPPGGQSRHPSAHGAASTAPETLAGLSRRPGSSAAFSLAVRVAPALWGNHRRFGGDAWLQLAAMARLNPRIARVDL